MNVVILNDITQPKDEMAWGQGQGNEVVSPQIQNLLIENIKKLTIFSCYYKMILKSKWFYTRNFSSSNRLLSHRTSDHSYRARDNISCENHLIDYTSCTHGPNPQKLLLPINKRRPVNVWIVPNLENEILRSWAFDTPQI